MYDITEHIKPVSSLEKKIWGGKLCLCFEFGIKMICQSPMQTQFLMGADQVTDRLISNTKQYKDRLILENHCIDGEMAQAELNENRQPPQNTRTEEGKLR